jgi:hypothetical protein
LDVSQRNVRSGSRQRPTDAKADAVRRASDESDLAVDLLQLMPPLIATNALPARIITASVSARQPSSPPWSGL